MKITSPAFNYKETIPSKFTCEGENINPPLAFSDVPENARSLVLIMDDPDAPIGTWAHWTMWNIDPQTREIAENSSPAESIEGHTSFGRPGYGGPCPPSGTHRYFFKLYALNDTLDLGPSTDKEKLEETMARYVITSSELIGLYKRQ